jgi:ketosteroid isomerase-like protein
VDALAIAQQWQDATNTRDVERLLELSAPDIEIVGPRGSGHGHQLLRNWLGRVGARSSGGVSGETCRSATIMERD